MVKSTAIKTKNTRFFVVTDDCAASIWTTRTRHAVDLRAARAREVGIIVDRRREVKGATHARLAAAAHELVKDVVAALARRLRGWVVGNAAVGEDEGK
jgi:hypothetical protein